MKQSHGTSLLKSIVSTTVGFGISFIAQIVFLPMLGVTINLTQNTVFAIIMTIISIGRGYIMERVFEALGWRTRMSAFVLKCLAELQRQRTQEGWTIEHDNEHEHGELARAGAAYLYAGSLTSPILRERLKGPGGPIGSDTWNVVKSLWPWDWGWWKPDRDDDVRRDLVRGVALGLAEGERFDRQRKSSRRVLPDEPPRVPMPAVNPTMGASRPRLPTTGSGVR